MGGQRMDAKASSMTPAKGMEPDARGLLPTQGSQGRQTRRRRLTLSCVRLWSNADWTVAASSSLSFS